MPIYAFDPTTIRQLTPEGNELVKRLAAVAESPDTHHTAMDLLRAHVHDLVVACVAMSPDEPERWMARLEAALLVAVDIARDLRHEGGAAYLHALVKEHDPS